MCQLYSGGRELVTICKINTQLSSYSVLGKLCQIFQQQFRRGAYFTSLNMFRTTTFNIQGECLNPAVKGGTWTEASYHVAFFITLEECVNNLFMTSTDTGRGCLQTSHLSVCSNLIHTEFFSTTKVCICKTTWLCSVWTLRVETQPVKVGSS